MSHIGHSLLDNVSTPYTLQHIKTLLTIVQCKHCVHYSTTHSRDVMLQCNIVHLQTQGVGQSDRCLPHILLVSQFTQNLYFYKFYQGANFLVHEFLLLS